MKTSPAPCGVRLYAFAGLPCTDVSMGTAGPLAGLRQDTEYKYPNGSGVYSGTPRSEVNTLLNVLHFLARIRHADNVEAGIDMDHFARD